MTPRKTILRELDRLHTTRGPDATTAVKALPGFDSENPKFTAAVNRLLQDRLVNGLKGEDGAMALSLNASRMREVKRELRPWYAHPGVWALLMTAGVAGAASLLM